MEVRGGAQSKEPCWGSAPSHLLHLNNNEVGFGWSWRLYLKNSNSRASFVTCGMGLSDSCLLMFLGVPNGFCMRLLPSNVKCNGSQSPVEGLWVCSLIRQSQGVSTTKWWGWDPSFGNY